MSRNLPDDVEAALAEIDPPQDVRLVCVTAYSAPLTGRSVVKVGLSAEQPRSLYEAVKAGLAARGWDVSKIDVFIEL